LETPIEQECFTQKERLPVMPIDAVLDEKAALSAVRPLDQQTWKRSSDDKPIRK
jgi:hypothetical protein